MEPDARRGLYHRALAAEAARDLGAARELYGELAELGEGELAARATCRLGFVLESSGAVGEAAASFELHHALHGSTSELLERSALHELVAFYLRAERWREAAGLLAADPVSSRWPRAQRLGRCELIRRLLATSSGNDHLEVGAQALPVLCSAAEDGRPEALGEVLWKLADADLVADAELWRATECLLSAQGDALLEASSIIAIRKLAQRLTSAGELELALRAWRIGRRSLRHRYGCGHPTTLAATVGVARCLHGRGDVGRSRRLFRYVVARSTSVASLPETEGDSAAFTRVERSALIYLVSSLRRTGSSSELEEAGRLAGELEALEARAAGGRFS